MRKEDLTGRSYLVSNVLLNWGTHSVFILAGFILPRMIDRRLGQEMLGVWDFSWSLVNYFQLVRTAIGSSINRYVARYWAAGDITGVNRTVSSAFFVLGLGGLVVMGLTAVAILLLPQLSGSRLGENVHEAQGVVLFLGATLAVQACFSAFTGVLTGCHRWGLHNINSGGWYAVTVTGMVVALLLGEGLRTMAAIMLAGEILSSARRVVLAGRVCKGLRVRSSLIQWSTIRDQFAFGGKTLIPSVSNLLLDQTTSVLIAAYLGPAALALYTRPFSLMHHIRILVNKMAMTLTPIASSLQSESNLDEIRRLVITSARYASYLSLPMVLLLAIHGGPILQLWMGPRYADGVVPAILATGYFFALIQQPVLNVLAGLNAHGRAGITRLAASLCSVGLSVVVLRYLCWGLVGTAIAVTLPLAAVNVAEIPRLACRQVGLSARRYFLFVVVEPMIRMLPYAACLVGARLVFWTEPLIGLVVSGVVGGAILGIVYWRYVLPESVRRGLLQLWQNGREWWRTLCC